MDCIRVSEREIKGFQWDGYHYQSLFPLDGDTVDSCRQKCVSNLKCKAWKWEPEDGGNPEDGTCYITRLLKGNYPRVKKVDNKDVMSGLIRCEDNWSMLKFFGYLLLMFVILGFAFFFMFICPKRKKAGRIEPLKF